MTLPPSLTRFAWLSIAAALATMALKSGAYLLTGSVGLLSDALESGVNLVAAVVALLVLRFAEAPPDDEHPFGHDKAEYFSSGVEGGLIFAAAIGTIIPAVNRLLNPVALDSLGAGVAVSLVASAINFGVARVLFRAAREARSIVLEADAHHLMTDVWTSAGVLVGVGLVAVTGWEILDPIIAILVAANITWTAVALLRRSAHGLLDSSLRREEQDAVVAILNSHVSPTLRWHALRTRQAGSRQFVEFHILVPGATTVTEGHDQVERIEQELRGRFPRVSIVSHLEPLEDARAYEERGAV